VAHKLFGWPIFHLSSCLPRGLMMPTLRCHLALPHRSFPEGEQRHESRHDGIGASLLSMVPITVTPRGPAIYFEIMSTNLSQLHARRWLCAPTLCQMCKCRTFAATAVRQKKALQSFATESNRPSIGYTPGSNRRQTLVVGMIDGDLTIPDAKRRIYGFVPFQGAIQDGLVA
jgi:hypothetical protein